LFLDASESDDAVEIISSSKPASSHHAEPKSRTKQKEMMRLSPPTSPGLQLCSYSASDPKIPSKISKETENNEEDEEFAELDAWLQSGCVDIL
jgi:hypothetical protein